GSANVATLEGLSDAFAAVADRVKPSVVYIESTQHQRVRTPQLEIPPEFQPFFRGWPQGPRSHENIERSSGSGVIVSADGDILTNAHVVDGADHVMVRLLDHRQFTAKVIGTDPTTDIALIRIHADHLVPATLGNSDDARVGEWVLAVGNPLGENLSFTVTSGIISAKGRTLALPNSNERSIQDFIQTDAAINPGNSGGPLVNVRGEVIGINAAIASETGFYTGYGFAIPVNLAREVMDQLEHGGKVHRAALGIRVRNAGQTDAAYVGLKEVRGVVVEDLGDGDSPAHKAGLKAGDVIVAVDGQPVDYVAQVQQDVAFRKPGDVVTLDVMRKGGQKVSLKVQLQEAPSAAEPAATEDDQSSVNPEAAATIGALGLTVQAGQQGGESGLVVTSVDPDGPSADHVAGPNSGGPDVIQSIEGHKVTTVAELREAVKQAGSGTIVELGLYNAPGQTHRVEHVRLQ
ncbi:MAG TPA: trypsin-like peptidase domain-containing protein, partial [Gemmatimonadales bacterium]|nr:trypsin-like peptidase domain-containing protein [Gemmatimonadales bacterium]